MPKGPPGYTPLPSGLSEYFKKPERRTDVILILLLSLSVLCNILFVSKWIVQIFQEPFRFPEVGYSPAQYEIAYKTVKFHRGLQNDIPIYEQPPSNEVDKAWEGLYQYAGSRVSKSEVAQMTNDTWPILDEPGNYVIALDVFHQLHCLDILRQQLHPGRNYTVRSGVHLRHCIGAIRQSLMCYADISPVVWQWSTRYEEAEQRDDILHTCRDFDRLQGWARERSLGGLPDLSVYIEG
ncbi:hypothetical protein B0H14DRAFT_3123662 [Mycena olivaceomarginata]|nr:hypothetical protein B0H14DRAFT_3123662 [Mycena olivaceomarginata]